MICLLSFGLTFVFFQEVSLSPAHTESTALTRQFIRHYRLSELLKNLMASQWFTLTHLLGAPPQLIARWATSCAQSHILCHMSVGGQEAAFCAYLPITPCSCCSPHRSMPRLHCFWPPQHNPVASFFPHIPSAPFYPFREYCMACYKLASSPGCMPDGAHTRSIKFQQRHLF